MLINHCGLEGSRRPQAPKNIAQLHADIERVSHTTGLYTLPINTPPEQWTTNTIITLIHRVLRLIPNDIPGAKDEDADIEITADMRYRNSRVPTIHIGRDGRQYTATIRIDRRAATPLKNFAQIHALHDYDRDSFRWRGTLEDLNDIIATDHQNTTTDDDDLDAIEKAARRTLHGDRNTPGTPASTERWRSTLNPCDVATVGDAHGAILFAFNRLTERDQLLVARIALDFMKYGAK